MTLIHMNIDYYIQIHTYYLLTIDTFAFNFGVEWKRGPALWLGGFNQQQRR